MVVCKLVANTDEASYSLNLTDNITTYIIYRPDMEIYIYMYNAICQIENFFYKFHFQSQYNACNKSDSIIITVQEITKNCNTCWNK